MRPAIAAATQAAGNITRSAEASVGRRGSRNRAATAMIAIGQGRISFAQKCGERIGNPPGLVHHQMIAAVACAARIASQIVR